MKIKKLMLMLLSVLITGCTVEYNLVINDDKTVDESITVLQPNSSWGNNIEEINEQIDWTLVFAKDETEPAYFYNQEKIVGDTNSGVQYQYKFDADEFTTQSEFLRNCFTTYDFSLSDTSLYINASEFICSSALGNDFTLDINIVADGEVISGNYDTRKDNKYTWNISPGDDTYIYLNIDVTKTEETIIDKLDTNNMTPIVVVGLIVVFLGVILLIAYIKNKENNS